MCAIVQSVFSQSMCAASLLRNTSSYSSGSFFPSTYRQVRVCCIGARQFNLNDTATREYDATSILSSFRLDSSVWLSYVPVDRWTGRGTEALSWGWRTTPAAASWGSHSTPGNHSSGSYQSLQTVWKHMQTETVQEKKQGILKMSSPFQAVIQAKQS